MLIKRKSNEGSGKGRTTRRKNIVINEDLEVPNVSLEVEKEDLKVPNNGEKETDMEEIFPSSIEKPLGGDILEALAVHKDGSSQDVTDETRSKWDHWLAINEEFKKEIEGDETWSFLSNKMFYVWEGNNRTASWMESIKEMWSNNKQRHIRVHAQFFSPQSKDELNLIAALQRFNLLNEHAIIVTNLRDYLYHVSTLCGCDAQLFVEGFSEEEKQAIEKARIKEGSGEKRFGIHLHKLCWLAWSFRGGCKKLPQSMPKEERMQKIVVIKRTINKTYSRKMHRILSIVNPTHGKEWFDVLWKLPFEDSLSRITLDKLYQISMATCSFTKKVMILSLLGADDNFKSSYGLQSSNHGFIRWLAKEVWMDQVLAEATRLLTQVVEKNMGGERDMTVASPPLKQVDLPNAARRMEYRYLRSMVESNQVSSLGTREIEKRKKSYDMDMVHLPLLAFLSMANKAIKDNVKVWCYDYIALGKQILQGDFTEGFNEMRGFFLGSGGHGRMRNNKACAWSVDLCLVDLPTRSSVGGVEGVPPWNILTDDHYLYSLGVAAASMDDNGWTLVMCSASSVAMVERYAGRVKLEICFRWVATTSECYLINEKHGFKVKENAFHVMAFRKLGYKPPIYESQVAVGKLGSWRGFMEESPTFILMFLDFLSLSSATLLELGAGTGPLMRAALYTGRRCLVIDNDNELCDNLLTPYVKSYAHDAVPSIPHVIDDDVDTILEFSAPMDW
ncbi:hypothetical protein L7F22_017821 [Adiantum nelumboides]|nr:hypothetical protein [Adiantum nelumboides]